MLSLDRSSGLLELARNEGINECIRADLGFRGWRNGVFVGLDRVSDLQSELRDKRGLYHLDSCYSPSIHTDATERRCSSFDTSTQDEEM